MAITFLMHVPEHYVVYLIVSFFSGIACGAIGVGGVFLVPTLIIIGIHARVAIVAVVASFFPVSLVYTIFAIRDNRIHIGSYKILVFGKFTNLMFSSICFVYSFLGYKITVFFFCPWKKCLKSSDKKVRTFSY